METLPLDIFLYIIDLLDFKSLRILSQACKSMVPLCRKRLFSSLRLRNKWKSESFTGLLSKNPDIACYVRRLNYGVCNSISDHELNILDMLKKRSSLQSIKLWSPRLHWNWNDFPESIRSSLAFLIQLPTVVQLTVISIKGFPLTALSGCSNLIDLEFSNIELAPPEVDQVISRSKIPAPASLYIDETFGVAGFLNSASQHADGPIVDFSRLQKARFVVQSQRGICQVIELIKKTIQLEYFNIQTFSLSRSVWFEGLGASLAINACRTLKSLALSITFVGDDHDPLCGLIPELRFTAGNNVLEELELEIVSQEGASCRTESEDWSAFDSVLTESGAFPMLHRVLVKIRWHSTIWNLIEQNAVLESLKEEKFLRLVESKAVVFEFSTQIHYER